MNPTVNILGLEVSAINLKMAIDTIDDWIRRREARYVCVTGVHGVMESYRNPAIKRVHNAAGMVTPDGMPLVWLSRAMGFRHVDRVYGPDLMLAICQNSIRRLSAFLLWRRRWNTGKAGRQAGESLSRARRGRNIQSSVQTVKPRRG